MVLGGFIIELKQLLSGILLLGEIRTRADPLPGILPFDHRVNI